MAMTRSSRTHAERRRRARRDAGCATARSRGAPADDNGLTAEQSLLVDCWVALVGAVMAVHALGALVYGRLSVFVLDGFADLHGSAAVCAAVAEVALVVAMACHRAADGTRIGRRWPERLYTVRLWAYLAVPVLACVAFVLTWVHRPRLTLSYPVVWPGLAPRSEWLLAPLPWTWRGLLPVAHDRVQFWLLLGAFVALGIGALCVSGSRKAPRAGLAFFGMAFVAAGFWSLGGAVYHYAAARGLANLHDAPLAALLQARPGMHNADTLLWNLTAATLTCGGVLFLAAAVALPQRALERAFAGVR